MPTYSSPYYNLGSLYEKLNQTENLEDLTKRASSKLGEKDPIILLFQGKFTKSNNKVIKTKGGRQDKNQALKNNLSNI